MKTLFSTLALALAAVSMPAQAQSAKIIGGGAQQYCKRWAETRLQPPPSDMQAWTAQCVDLARQQDACVTATGWTSGKPATAETERCYQTFTAAINGLPRMGPASVPAPKTK